MSDCNLPISTPVSIASQRAGRRLYVVLGPQRSGTTWIYRFLSALPGVATTRDVKELEFFGRNYPKGWRWYLKQFDAGATPLLDVSSTYIHSPAARDRISAANIDGVIICYRDPVDRIRSLHRHCVIHHGAATDFGTAWRDNGAYLTSSLYWANYQWWADAVGEDRVLVLDFAVLTADSTAYAAELCQFVGVDFDPGCLPEGKVNAARAMSNLAAGAWVSVAKQWLRRAGLGRLVSIVKASSLGTGFAGHSGSDAPDDLVFDEDDLRRFALCVEADADRFRRLKVQRREAGV